MAWNNTIKSGVGWSNFKRENDQVEAIWGISNLGSPHGHAVFVNGSCTYWRNFGNLTANVNLSGGKVEVFSLPFF